MRILRAARIARYLGPWADDTSVPPGISTTDEELPNGLRMRWFVPPRAKGMMFVMPGVHFEGPDDVRMDRFARIMAGAGRAVVVPFLPDYLRLQPTTAVFRDDLGDGTRYILDRDVRGGTRPTRWVALRASRFSARTAAGEDYCAQDRSPWQIVCESHCAFQFIARSSSRMGPITDR